MLDALRALGPRHGRAVVSFDPESIDASTLDDWHQLGVRGVRFNTKSIDKHLTEKELSITLRRYADIIRPYNWVLQVYVPLDTVTVLEKIVPELRVRVCLDRFGSPPSLHDRLPNGQDPYNLPGFRHW